MPAKASPGSDDEVLVRAQRPKGAAPIDSDHVGGRCFALPVHAYHGCQLCAGLVGLFVAVLAFVLASSPPRLRRLTVPGSD